MGNTFVTVKEIARQALPRLQEALLFPQLVYRDFSNTFKDLGATIQVRKPQIMSAVEFDSSTGVTYGDLAEETVDVALDKIATVDKGAEAIETATNIDDLNRIFVDPAVNAIAEKVNSDGLLLYKDIPYYVGTAGSTPDGLDDFANTRKELNILKVPNTPRYAIWDPEADAKFLTLDAIVNAEKSGSTQALREGSIGRVGGFDNYMAQGVKAHTKGTLAAGGTNGKITVKTAVNTAANAVILDVTADANGTLTGTLLKGDILSISGSPYVVTANATAETNQISVSIYPKITVAADIEVTVIGSHTANLAFHPMAFAFVTRPLINPNGQGVESYVTSFNGLSLRVTRGYDQKYKRSTYSMDILYGYKTVYPELAVRVLG